MAPEQSSMGFPSLKTSMRLNSLTTHDEPIQFFDVEFYPFTSPGLDPVFAVVGGCEAIVCRPKRSGIETIAWFRDEDPKTCFNSCCWSVDYESGDPLLILAGSRPVISIFNVRTRERVFGIAGHGKAINSLATSPLAPNVLASASFDKTVRIWSLDPVHRKQPCMVICGGEGHKEGLSTMAFHQSGRFLLTGGYDNMINCWVIPALPSADAGTDKVTTVYYPHFASMAIHTDFVDCVAWHGDLILSKCATERKIVLWRIERFDSSEPLPDPFPAPTTYEFRHTRSAWGGSFQRLLEFEVPEANLSWIRFELFPGLDPSEWAPEDSTEQDQDLREGGAGGSSSNYSSSVWTSRPVLAVGNTKSKVFFWDLQALEEWVPDGEGDGPLSRRGGRRRKSGRGGSSASRKRDSAVSLSGRTAARTERSGSDTGAAGSASMQSAADRLHSTPSGSRALDDHTPSSVQLSVDSAGTGSEPRIIPADAPAKSPTVPGMESMGPWTPTTHDGRGVERFGTNNPFQPLKAHRQMSVPKVTFCVRQISWSQGGEWMVAVGDQGMIALFGR